MTGRVTAVVPAIPGQPADAAVVLADLRRLSEAVYARSGTILPAGAVLAAQPPDPAAPQVGQRLAAAVPGGVLLDRRQLLTELRQDPFGTAGVAAFLLAAMVAGLLALLALAANAAALARERAPALSFLQALGGSAWQGVRTVAVEQVGAAIVALLGGLLLGGGAARLLVPSLVLTRQAQVPFPSVQVPVPTTALLLLLAASVVVLALALLVLAVAVRRRGIAAPLRIAGTP